MKQKIISKKTILGFCLLAVMGAQAQTFPTFTEVTPTGESIRNDLFRGHAAWGDFDNDGYYEAIVFSTDGDWGYDAFFLENVNGTLTRLNFTELGLPDFTNDRWDWSFAWIDYNNDGWMDLLFTGRQGSEGVAELYRNNGANTGIEGAKRFAPIENTGITGLQLEAESNYMSRIAVGDYNNDGYADIMLTGYTGPSEAKVYRTDLYKNDKGTGKFIVQPAPVDWLGELEAFATASGSSVILADLNNDGYLDVLQNGWNGGPKVNIYQNNGDGTFFGDYLFNPSFRTGDGDMAVGDFNNDGKMDILLTGASQNTKGVPDYPDWLSKSSLHLFDKIDADFNEIVYTEIMSPDGVKDMQVTGIDLADLNADGKLDFLAAGAGGNWSWEDPTTQLCLNNGDNTFAQSLTALPALRGAPSVTFADYDNDGYLDVMLLGYGNSATFKVYKNDGNLTRNTAPLAPSGLSSSYDAESGKWTFTWDAGSDAETPVQSLRYNLFVKLPETGGEVFTNIPADIVTGYLKSTRHHAALTATTYNMELPFEEFEWGVQTIDQGKSGSVFATATTSVEANSIATPVALKARVYTSNGHLYVNSNLPATVTIYNMNGRQIASDGNVTDKAVGTKLPKGVYLVKVQAAKDSKVFKVILL